jgi:hypothetical protein
MRWWAALLLAGCTVPDLHSGNLQCAPAQRCPDGFHCAADDRCWRSGDDPDLGVAADLALADGPAADLAQPDLARPDLAGSHDLATVEASKCAGSTALLCDGFEAAALNAQWAVGAVNGTAEIDSARAFRGGRSLHLHTAQVADGGAGVEATIGETRTFPQSGATVYVRVWAYLQSPYPAAAFDQFINFLDGSNGGIAYVLFNGLPLLNAYALPTQAFVPGSAPPIPLDRWTCLQMSITQIGASGTVHLMVDGVTSDATASNATTTAMVGVHLGPQFNGGGAGFGASDVWLDEVIVDNQSISCGD